MALTRIWSAFIILSILVATLRLGFESGNRTIFSAMVVGKTGDTIKVKQADSASVAPAIWLGTDSNRVFQDAGLNVVRRQHQVLYFKKQTSDGVIETAKTAVNLSLGLIGIMALFMGFMRIAELAGGGNFLSRIIGPFFSRIFPEVPKGHPAYGHMMLNFSANLLGLDNAATPFGIKAMESLQSINPNKETASNAQLMFLCLHASGLTLIPVAIIALRASAKAANPMDIFIPCMIATFAATLAA
ncbi:MAG TPA: nucleoside recognition domain-containing protein, partial [Ferruginibacter sp.]|nr:nucleoside recognition domain-containing protein [Ferruginibacter sp.]